MHIANRGVNVILRNNTKAKTLFITVMLLVVAACGGSDSGGGGDLIPTAEPPGPPVSDLSLIHI